ncbi:MAG: hypothetical protein ACTSQI_17840 [Candidatus Helarchaeota archaeon]
MLTPLLFAQNTICHSIIKALTALPTIVSKAIIGILFIYGIQFLYVSPSLGHGNP